MKTLSNDITVTLIVKLCLLFLLWWFCVRGLHPVLLPAQQWILGTTPVENHLISSEQRGDNHAPKY